MTEQEIENPRALAAQTYTRRRVFGSEQEYGILARCKNRASHQNEEFCGYCWNLSGSNFLFRENGGKVYNDCGHPEYASPEASNPLDAMIFDKAGELLVPRKIVEKVRLYKNNNDGKGKFYGSHENYSINANVWDDLQRILPFLASRIIFTGSGNINENGEFELSQRARATHYSSSSSTTRDRAIINTKDESLSEDSNFRRLHVICGDGNLSQVASYLKFGTMGLVLDLLEDGKIPEDAELIGHPVNVFQQISRDLSLKERVYTSGSGETNAIKIQRYFQSAAEKAYRGRDAMTDDILDRWSLVLDGLEEDPRSLGRQLDWVIKKNLIDAYMAKTGKSLSDPSVRNIDLQYHELGERGLFNMLQSRGLVDRIVSDEQIEYAVTNAPSDTRAWIRAEIINGRVPGNVPNWSKILLINSGNNSPRIMDPECVNCPSSCKKYLSSDQDQTVLLNDPLHNYAELKKQSKNKDKTSGVNTGTHEPKESDWR